ncbi:MAG: tetratricopeptide repeat protein [Phycisphaerales bacterium]
MSRPPVPFCIAWLFSMIAAGCVVVSPMVQAQSVDERLDEASFLRGLSQHELPEILEHYMAQHPPADQIEAMTYQLTALSMRLNNPALSLADRIDAIHAVLDARTALIEQHPFDPRHALWLADQAGDYYLNLYPLEAGDITAEFGVATHEQIERSRLVARNMHEAAADAEIEIAETILNLESEPGFADDIALQLQRRRLARDERDRRIPFLRGIGAFLHAEFNVQDASERKALYELAAELLPPLTRELDGFLQNRARLYAGLAMARLGDFDTAETYFREVATDPDAGSVDVFRARMGGVLNRAVSNGPQAGLEAIESIEEKYTADEDVFFRIILTDRRFLLMRQMAGDVPQPQRHEQLKAAYNAYFGLLDALSSEMRERIRPIIFQKLAMVADESVPLAELPSIVAIARAVNLSQDAATRADAIAMLQAALQREDIDERAQAEALFGLARALYDNEQQLAAAEQYETFARTFPLDLRAERAIQIAAALLLDVRSRGNHTPEIDARLRSVLDHLLERFANLPTIEQWRYEAGQLAFEMGDVAAAQALFERTPPTAATWLDSRYMLSRCEFQQAMETRDTSRLQTVMANARKTRELIERTPTADADRAQLLHMYQTSIRAIEAEAAIDLGLYNQALAAIEPITIESNVDGGLLGRVLGLRVRALQAAGRGNDASVEIQRFATARPGDVGRIVPPMLVALRNDVETLIRTSQQDAATRKAQEELLPLAVALETWLAGAGSLDEQARTAIRVGIADSYRLAGEYASAAALYEDVIRAAPQLLEAQFGLAECRYATGSYEAAMTTYKRIAATQSERDRYYWTSELRMLQILEKVQKNVHQIRPRVEMLAQQDAELGGDDLRREFDALRIRHSAGGG